jgi:hypothetical protein
MTVASKFMFAALAIVSAGYGLTACGAGAIATPPERPAALATLGRFAAGSQGQISGYLRGWPIAGDDQLLEAQLEASDDPLFTYLVDFKVVETSPINGLPVRATGVRRVYFHPGGVRIEFGDTSRFINGEPVAVEQVSFTFEFMPGFAEVKVRMQVHQTTTRPFQYEGRTITPIAERDDTFVMYGRFSAVYRGLLLTGAGA